MAGLKNVFKQIGKAIAFLFVSLYRLFLFLLDNTIGLIFNRKFNGYNKALDKDKIWYKVRFVLQILVLLLLIFSFNEIYYYTIGQVIGSFITWIGTLFKETSIYGKILIEYGHKFSEGIGTTLYLSLIGTTIGFIFAIFLSLIVTLKRYPEDGVIKKTFKSIGKWFVKTYVTVIRGTPMMVQAMIIYWGGKTFVDWDHLIAALVVVSLNTTAYLTEVLRGGIESIDKGQQEGGLSLGLSNFQTMMTIVFPQAIKNSMASIGNEFVINIKDTSVLSVILVVDLFRVAQLAQAKYLNPFPPFIIVAVIYLILTSTITAILKRVSKVLEVPEVKLPSAN